MGRDGAGVLDGRLDPAGDGAVPGQHLVERGMGRKPVLDDEPTLDIEDARCATVAAAQALTARRPDVGALVLECTNMPPYADAVRAATGRTVHHLVGLLAQRFAPPVSGA